MFGAYEQVTRPGSGWKQMPDWMNEQHQNNKGKREIKFVHPDGQELIFDGDSKKLITKPEIRRTYNYYTPKTLDSIKGVKDIQDLAASWRGHILADMIPDIILGTNRKKKE